jgi:hypothetical protein
MRTAAYTAIAVLIVRVGAGTASAQTGARVTVTVDQLRLQSVTQMTLVPDHYSTASDGTTVRIRAQMRRSAYQVVATAVRDRHRVTLRETAWCYRFTCRHRARPYTYTWWTPDKSALPPDSRFPPDNLRLFHTSRGRTYIAFVSHLGTVYLMDVSRGNDMRKALREYLVSKVRQPIIALPLGEVFSRGGTVGRAAEKWLVMLVQGLFPIGAFARASGPYTVRLEGIDDDSKGRLLVTVSGRDPARRHTAVFADGRWSAAN